MVVTAGAVIGSGLVGAGLNAGIYSVTHKDAQGKSFWKGYAVNAAVGFTVGAVTGGLASAFSTVADAAAESLVQRGLSWAASRGIQALSIETIEKTTQYTARAAVWAAFGSVTTGVGDTFTQFMSNVVDKDILGDSNLSLTTGTGRAFLTGFAFGAVAGAFQGIADAAVLKPKSYGPEEFSSEPVEMKGMGADEGTPLVGHGGLYKPNLSVQSTVKSRLFSSSSVRARLSPTRRSRRRGIERAVWEGRT